MIFGRKGPVMLAASALALSLAGAANAADETSVTLQDGQPCNASVMSGSFDFGTWEWNGTAYEEVDAPSGTLTIAVTNSEYLVDTCDVAVTPGDLDPSSATETGKIPGTDVVLEVASGSASTSSPYQVTTPGMANLVLSATLSTDLDDFEPSQYQGDITVSASASSG